MKLRTQYAPARGFALVIVLWAGVLLSIIAASFAFGMRVETRLAVNLMDRAKAQAVADAGIYRGVLALLVKNSGSGWVADGRSYELPFGDGKMRIRLQSEAGKVDLNGAPDALIEGLVTSLVESGDLSDSDEAARIAAAILDWRDADHNARPSGAEDADYRASGRPVGARDGAFLSVDELNQVLGVNPATYARLAPLVTVYSWAPQVDPMTAPRSVLLAVPGLDTDRVDKFLLAREALTAAEPQDGDEVVRLPMELLSPGARYLSRSVSSVYTIDAEAELPEGAQAGRRAVIQLTQDARRPYVIVAWFDSIPGAETESASLGLQ